MAGYECTRRRVAADVRARVRRLHRHLTLQAQSARPPEQYQHLNQHFRSSTVSPQLLAGKARALR
jgi:hypothetical protein